MKKKEFNPEIQIDNVFSILTKIQNNPEKFESIFTELFEKDFQLQPRSKSCKLTRWQPKYMHQRSLDCLEKLNF